MIVRFIIDLGLRLGFLILPILTTFGQNLVPNGGFEEYLSLPKKHSEINLAFPWKQLTVGGADLYNLKSYVLEKEIIPYKGNGYAGFLVINSAANSKSNNNEFISVQLKNKLNSNQKYYIEFFIYYSNRLHFAYNFSVNNISAIFSNNSVSNQRDVKKTSLGNSVQYDNELTILNQTNTWIKVSGNFIAKGGEEFMTIGNFDPLDQIDYISLQGELKKIKLPEYIRLYFYIDEIKVIPVDENGNEIFWEVEANINKTQCDSLLLENPIKIENIYFESGSSFLKEESYKSLDILYQQLIPFNNTKYEIEISGHTDNLGKKEDNLILSELRAQAVASYLINKGINREIIKHIGYGSSSPIARNDSEKEIEMNRRVELIIRAK